MKYTNEQEFDRRLSELGDHYETIKDGLYCIDMRSRYEFEKAFEALVKMRNEAAMMLRAHFEIKDDN